MHKNGTEAWWSGKEGVALFCCFSRFGLCVEKELRKGFLILFCTTLKPPKLFHSSGNLENKTKNNSGSETLEEDFFRRKKEVPGNFYVLHFQKKNLKSPPHMCAQRKILVYCEVPKKLRFEESVKNQNKEPLLPPLPPQLLSRCYNSKVSSFDVTHGRLL